MSLVGKTAFAEKIAAKMNVSKKQGEKMVDAFLSTVKEELSEGNEVQFIGFGKFYVTKRAARKGTNPQTKQPIDIPATKVAKFKAGSKLDDAVK